MNKRTQEKTKTTGILYNSVIVLLILIIVISSCIGTFAWAKYTSAINGTTTAQIAKWSFKLVDGVTETTNVIDFAITRTDGYGKVVEERLAPGTFGEFQIGIDARGTETILKYEINVELENKPTNLKLYSDSEKTQEIFVVDNKFTIDGFMSLEDVKEIKTITIYWDWPYESGNDEQDTQDAGKIVNMKISVTGTEILTKELLGSYTSSTKATIDCTSIGGYSNLTADDFVIELTKTTFGGFSGSVSLYDCSVNRQALTKTYNSETGILTISGGYGYQLGRTGSQSSAGTISGSSVNYNVYLTYTDKNIVAENLTNSLYTTSQAIDCTSVSGYKNLSADDFTIELVTTNFGGFSGNVIYYDCSAKSFDIAKSYDSETGILTVSGGYGAQYGRLSTQGSATGKAVSYITYNVLVNFQ